MYQLNYQYINLAMYRINALSTYQSINPLDNEGSFLWPDSDEAIYQSISLSIDQFINLSIYQFINLPIYQRIDLDSANTQRARKMVREAGPHRTPSGRYPINRIPLVGGTKYAMGSLARMSRIPRMDRQPGRL